MAGYDLMDSGNTALLFYAISTDCHCRSIPKIIIYWYSYCELMTAQGESAIQYISSGLYLIIICLDTGEKDFWAAGIIMLGTFIKIYPIVDWRSFLLKAESEIISLFVFSGIGLLL